MANRMRISFLCTGNSCRCQIAEGAETEEEALEQYRRVRDRIRIFSERLPGILKG